MFYRTVKISLTIMSAAFFALVVVAAPNEPTNVPVQTNVKFRQQDKLSFDSQVVEGSLRTDDINIVTGESDEILDGLLKLRNDFKDHTALMQGTEVKP